MADPPDRAFLLESAGSLQRSPAGPDELIRKGSPTKGTAAIRKTKERRMPVIISWSTSTANTQLSHSQLKM